MTDVYLIADAMARELNSAELLPEGVTAYADPLPEFELEELENLQAVFVPVGSSLEDANRGERLESAEITLGLLKRISGKQELKELAALELRIMEWFHHREFTAGKSECVCRESEMETLFDGEKAKTENCFFGVLRLEVEIYD
ncbi:MAG: hypothetical protein ACI4UV_09125 [Victivallales bacterium]